MPHPENLIESAHGGLDGRALFSGLLAGRLKMEERNVLGGPLAELLERPITGFFRNGSCVTSPEDAGRHMVCA